MKVFISVDIEGCAGVVGPFHTARAGDDYGVARRWMTREANAAIEGAFAGGATEILVNDSHGSMTNLVLDELDPRARVITGNTKTLSMMEGIDGGFDAAMFVGYHTAAGETGTISHTMAIQFHHVRLNGEPCGEFDLNAAVAGQYGARAVLLSGDDRICTHIAKRYPQVRAVEVKKYRGRYACDNLHPTAACAKIRSAAAEAIKNAAKVERIVLREHVMEIDLPNEVAAEYAAMLPCYEQVGARTVRFSAPDAAKLYQMQIVLGKIAVGAIPVPPPK
ncbi:MAG: M55 family metallopeptidase [Planctomycetes bacterium]|nr:M55 family metallopeptidase [Planctomycetota bacterium]